MERVSPSKREVWYSVAFEQQGLISENTGHQSTLKSTFDIRNKKHKILKNSLNKFTKCEALMWWNPDIFFTQ